MAQSCQQEFICFLWSLRLRSSAPYETETIVLGRVYGGHRGRGFTNIMYLKKAERQKLSILPNFIDSENVYFFVYWTWYRSKTNSAWSYKFRHHCFLPRRNCIGFFCCYPWLRAVIIKLQRKALKYQRGKTQWGLDLKYI